jgi:hypothetical protein
LSEVVSINSKIVSVGIKDTNTEKPNIVVNTNVDKLDRPDVLKGTTYKIKTPLTKSSMYITINDIVLNKGTSQESVQPFEIFINSRDVSNLQWVVSLTRLISAIFRRGGDVSFIVRELLSTFDPAGGYLSKGKYVPSLVAEIGLILEEHFKKIGVISTEVDSSMIQYVNDKIKESDIDINTVRGEYCSKCGHHSVHHTDGCSICTNCGDSKCSG